MNSDRKIFMTILESCYIFGFIRKRINFYLILWSPLSKIPGTWFCPNLHAAPTVWSIRSRRQLAARFLFWTFSARTSRWSTSAKSLMLVLRVRADLVHSRSLHCRERKFDFLNGGFGLLGDSFIPRYPRQATDFYLHALTTNFTLKKSWILSHGRHSCRLGFVVIAIHNRQCPAPFAALLFRTGIALSIWPDISYMMIEPQVMYQKIKVMCCASAICSVSCTLFVQLESSPLSSAVIHHADQGQDSDWKGNWIWHRTNWYAFTAP